MREFMLGLTLGAVLIGAIWFIVDHYSTLSALRREAMPLEVRFLQGEKLSREEAERLAGIHNEIERIRR